MLVWAVGSALKEELRLQAALQVTVTPKMNTKLPESEPGEEQPGCKWDRAVAPSTERHSPCAALYSVCYTEAWLGATAFLWALWSMKSWALCMCLLKRSGSKGQGQ